MKKQILLIAISLTLATTSAIGQSSGKEARYFGGPIWTDSLSTIFFPALYNEEFLSTNKIAFWGDYYANVIVYDFKADTYRKLFPSDTYIAAMRGVSNRFGEEPGKPKNITPKWVFLLVKNNDYNNSKRIDEKDPSLLFATTIKGENLRALTDETENVVSFDIFNDQGFALIRIQRDSNKDRSFKNEDKDFYYRKVDLGDLSLGKPIELK